MANTTPTRLRHNQGVMETLKRISRQYLEEGRPDEALRVIQACLEARPDDPEAIGLRQKALGSRGR